MSMLMMMTSTGGWWWWFDDGDAAVVMVVVMITVIMVMVMVRLIVMMKVMMTKMRRKRMRIRMRRIMRRRAIWCGAAVWAAIAGLGSHSLFTWSLWMEGGKNDISGLRNIYTSGAFSLQSQRQYLSLFSLMSPSFSIFWPLTHTGVSAHGQSWPKTSFLQHESGQFILTVISPVSTNRFPIADIFTEMPCALRWECQGDWQASANSHNLLWPG